MKLDAHNLVFRLRKSNMKVGVRHFRYVKKTEDKEEVPQLINVTQQNRKEVGNILSNGGSTSVRITFPDGAEFVEESHCNDKDTFCRRLGILIAVGRIFDKRKQSGIIDVLTK